MEVFLGRWGFYFVWFFRLGGWCMKDWLNGVVFDFFGVIDSNIGLLNSFSESFWMMDNVVDLMLYR